MRRSEGKSLYSMLEDTKKEGNRVRVVFVDLKTDYYFDIPRENWYSITVNEFYQTVAQKLPESHPPGALFFSYRGREQLLPENSLLSAYNITSDDAVLLLKPKPQIINVFLHKRFHIDSNVSVQNVIPLIHYALSRHDWIDDENDLYIAQENASHLPLPDQSDTYPEVLSTKHFMKLNESDTISESESTKTFFLHDDAHPLLACEPTSVFEFQGKGPKQKSLSFTNRNAEPMESKKEAVAALTNALEEKEPTGEEKSEETQIDVLKLEPVEGMGSPSEKKRNKHFLVNLRTESFLRLRGKDPEKPELSDSLNIPHHLQYLTTVEDNGKRFFGISLETIMSRPSETGNVPSPVQMMATYLESSDAFAQEGIFRLCGNQANIASLINEIDSGGPVDLSKYDTHEVANVFKLYFQLLPEPVLTFKYYPRFMAAVCLEDKQLRNTYYNTLLATVPELRRKVARFLVCLLTKVAAQKELNKMGPKNLGIVFGPLLLRCQKQESDVYKSYLHYSKYIINCTKHLISSFDSLFKNVPPIEVVRTLTSYFAKKPGELDLQENAVIFIFSKGEEECFSESNGRFGTLPTHFLYGKDGKLKCSTLPPGKSKMSTPPQSRAKAFANARPKKSGSRRSKKSNTLSDNDFMNTFKVPKDIFLLLPKWKQDEMLREIGLLDPQQSGDTTPSPANKAIAGNRTTIPVRPQGQKNT